MIGIKENDLRSVCSAVRFDCSCRVVLREGSSDFGFSAYRVAEYIEKLVCTIRCCDVAAAGN